ncbi:unnamed protein product [Macrosiphum euphorbiae]|uniref:FP protein C-terminal domain-containing protein n=2 Tax=Macrosiphum euphorbiae TaxID=13131 RepID=A0AAV0X9D2_9HEMI|nr:unnamed protein product [Macrosiphum euphorbiae]CAI6366439.1 unnamed protein product [Macrosiphum euphorbiae]
MPSTCLKCYADLAQNDDILECSICKGINHYYCAGYTEHNFKKMSNNTKARFTCENCLVIKQNSPKSNNPDRKTGATLENNIQELTRSVSFMSKQFDNFNVKLDNVILELKNIKIENEKIKSENNRLSEEVVILKSKIDEIEQFNLGITVDITGIPKTINEDCKLIVEDIGKKTNTEINILEAYRIDSIISKRSIIVAKLATRDMRKNLIRNVKSVKLTTDKICNSWQKENIYINERLTKLKRTLFYQVKTAAKEKGYKFIWLSDADILARKNENTKIIKIKSPQDINHL